MTDADNQQLIKLMLQCLDAHDVDGLMELMSPDVEFIQPDPIGTTRGREAMAQRVAAQFGAFSEDRTEVRSLASCGDRVPVELMVTITHTGTLRTSNGDLPPTGRTISIPYCNVLRIEAGRISSAHVYVDQLGFIAQSAFCRSRRQPRSEAACRQLRTVPSFGNRHMLSSARQPTRTRSWPGTLGGCGGSTP